jgi:Glycosyl transferase family 2
MAVSPLNQSPHAPVPDACLLTVLIPCLNEAETIGTCVAKAMAFLRENAIAGEVLVVDNGSTDHSQKIAAQEGARVVSTSKRGYGAALNAGIAAARGRYVIMGDADDSYDLRNLESFLNELNSGADLVMGNRFRGGIEIGAMPWLHRYLGNPVLTAIGRMLFAAPVRDFHCGLRGFRRDSIRNLELKTTGMEFASEMVVRASLAGLRIAEVPTTLKKDGRSRLPHLRTWRDGWRHLRFLLLHSPRWTFVYPGIALILIGALGAAMLAPGPLHITARISLDVHTFLVACIAMLLGTQSLTFGLIARRYAERKSLLPPSRHHRRLIEAISLEWLLRAAVLLFTAGMAGMGWAVFAWSRTGFGQLIHNELLRLMIISTCGIAASVQLGFSAFLLGVIDLPAGDARQQQSALRDHLSEPGK